MMALDIAKQFANPVPATKKSSLIKDFKAERKDRLLSFAVYINATSTRRPKTAPERMITQSQAAARNSQLHEMPVPAIITPWFSRWWIEDEGFWAGFP